MAAQVVSFTVAGNVPNRHGLRDTVVREGWVLPTPKGELTLWDVCECFRRAGAREVFVERVLPGEATSARR